MGLDMYAMKYELKGKSNYHVEELLAYEQTYKIGRRIGLALTVKQAFLRGELDKEETRDRYINQLQNENMYALSFALQKDEIDLELIYDRMAYLGEQLQSLEPIPAYFMDTPAIEVDECMYWRKANSVHGWMVKHVQGGVDDCGAYLLDKESLEALKELLEEIDATKDRREKIKLIQEKIPPTPGFFFGSYEIDSELISDLEFTNEWLDRIDWDGLDKGSVCYYYESSW